MRNKNRLLYVFVLGLSIVLIILGYKITKNEHRLFEDSMSYDKAKVIAIESIQEEAYSLGGDLTELKRININFEAELLSGSKKGETIFATQTIDELINVNPEQIDVGDKILVGHPVFVEVIDDWVFVDYFRMDSLIIMVGIFLGLIVLFGLRKGVNTVVTLVLTCATIFLVFIPGILKGYNIYLLTIGITTFIILMNFLLINGSSKKTWCAVIGNIGGVILAGILAVVMIKLLRLTGIIDSDVGLLATLNPESPIDILAIIWSGVVIGSLGAVMDVAITIASALQELADNMEVRQFKTMLKSGLNIGRDAMGTMTNTLILAYIGSSLSTVLLLVASNKNLMFLFNMEMIAVEMVQAVIGSIGILFAIPLTSVIAAFVYQNVNHNGDAT